MDRSLFSDGEFPMLGLESDGKVQTRLICFCMLRKGTAWFWLGLVIAFCARLTIIQLMYEQPR